MITPENENNLPLDDADNSDLAEQQSQQDVHSNGLGDTPDSEKEDNGSGDADRLNQADKASESSFTLNYESGIAPKAEQKEDTNIKE